MDLYRQSRCDREVEEDFEAQKNKKKSVRAWNLAGQEMEGRQTRRNSYSEFHDYISRAS